MLAPRLAERLRLEEEPDIAARVCLTAGETGWPGTESLVASVSRWRDHPDRFVHRSALVGLARIRTEPDPAMLAELAECLLMPDDAGWRSPDTVLANAAHCTLGGRRAREVPLLAEAIMESIGACDLSHRPDDLAAWVIGQPSLFEI